MKKVLQIGMTKNLGGIESYLMNQFRHLDRQKIVYDFVNITGEFEIAFEQEILQSGSKIYKIPTRHKNPIQHYFLWLKLLWKIRGQYSAIVLNGNSLSYVFPIFAAKFFGISKRIFHSHNSGDELKMSTARKILVAVNKILLSIGATDYFACSEKAGRWMFGSKKFRVINNAIDARKLQFDPKTRDEVRKNFNVENKFVMIHVGRFTFQKNHEFLIDVFSKVAEKYSDAVLFLIGDAVEDRAFLDSAQKKVTRSNLNDRVFFLGLRRDVDKLLQAADCFLLPSKFEGLPMSGIEAQAAGLPCIFSSNITTELEITRDLVQYVSLDAPLETWLEAVEKARATIRRNTFDEISNAGYDISTEVTKLEKFFGGDK